MTTTIENNQTGTVATTEQPKFQKSVDVQLIEKYLTDLPVGTVVSYEDLNGLIGGDVQHSDRHKLESARRSLERENLVWECIPKVGIKHLADGETVGSGKSYISRARRAARRGVKRVSAVKDYSALSNADKIEHNTVAAMCGALQHFLSSGATKKITAAVAENGEILAAKKTLQILSLQDSAGRDRA